MWKCYLVRCSNGDLYCGITLDLDKRIRTHNSGKGSKIVRGKLPVELVWYLSFQSRSEASQMEYAIKRYPKSVKEGLVLDGGELRNPGYGIDVSNQCRIG